MCLFAVSQPRSRSRPRDECPIPVVILPPPRPVYILHNEPPSPHTQRPDGHYRWCPTPCQGSHGPRAPMPRNIRFEDRSRFRGDTRHRRIEESREAEWKGMQQRNIRRPEPAYLGGRRMVKFRDTFDMDPRFRRGDDRTVSEESYSAPRHQHHREASPHDGYYPNDSPNGYPAHPHPGHHDRLPPDYSTECSTNGYRGPPHRSPRETYPPEYSLEPTDQAHFDYR